MDVYGNILRRLHTFFSQEKGVKHAMYLRKSVLHRMTKATGLSSFRIKNLLSKKKKTPTPKNNQRQNCILNSSNLELIRCKVGDLYRSGEYVTLTILRKVLEESGLKIAKATLHRALKTMGFNLPAMNLKYSSKRKSSKPPGERKKAKSSPSNLSFLNSHEKKTSSRKIASEKTSLLEGGSGDGDLEIIVLVENGSNYTPRIKHDSNDLLDDPVCITDDTAIAKVRNPKQRKLSLSKMSTQMVECSESAIENNDHIYTITRTDDLSSQSIEAIEVNYDAKIINGTGSCKVSNSSKKPLTKRKPSLGKQNVGKDVLMEVSTVSWGPAENTCSRQVSATAISNVDVSDETQQLDKDSLNKTELDDDDRSSTKTWCVPRAAKSCTRSEKTHSISNLPVRRENTEADDLNLDIVFHNTPTSSYDSCNTCTSDQELRITPTLIQVSIDCPISCQGVSKTST